MSRSKIITHANVYYLGVFLLMISLPTSKFGMSVAQLLLSANWLLEGKWVGKFTLFFKNRAAVAFSSLYLLHLAGLLYTSNFEYAWHDLRIKMPLFVLPIVMVTSPAIDGNMFRKLLFSYIGAVLVSSFICFAWFLQNDFIDIRHISPLISHIRLSLNICLASFILLFFLFEKPEAARWQKLLFGLAILWLLFMLFIMNSLTGITVLIAGTAIMFVHRLCAGAIPGRLAVILAGAGVAALTMGSWYLLDVYKEARYIHPVDLQHLELYTPDNHRYEHKPELFQVENGHYVYMYLCWEELEQEWRQRSAVPFDSVDLKGQIIRYTLAHFITSKGERKNAGAVRSLSDEEVRTIEKGISNVLQMDHYSLRKRLTRIYWQFYHFQRSGNPSGHSVMQRLAYWKAAIGLFRQHALIGVGTGDVNDAFRAYYDEIQSPLETRWRLRSHNQYLTLLVAFGLPGLAWLFFSLFYPPTRLGAFRDYLFFSFFTIGLLSFFWEDTLETQAGVTFFTFFYCLFLFGRQDPGASLVKGNEEVGKKVP